MMNQYNMGPEVRQARKLGNRCVERPVVLYWQGVSQKGEGGPLGMTYTLYCADCVEWLDTQPENSFEAIVTDPPYGLKEYSHDEQARLREGNRGGMWRIPPTLNGNTRAPLPR